MKYYISVDLRAHIQSAEEIDLVTNPEYTEVQEESYQAFVTQVSNEMAAQVLSLRTEQASDKQSLITYLASVSGMTEAELTNALA